MFDAPDSPIPVALIRGGAVRDAVAVDARPGGVVVMAGRVDFAGPWREAEARAEALALEQNVELRRIVREDALLLPGMVNAHAHLELTSIGPMPYGGSFTQWVRQLLEHRADTPQAIEEAVRDGAARSLASGVLVVGDIGGAVVGRDAAWRALCDSRLYGVAYMEVTGHDGAAAGRALAGLERLHGRSDTQGRWRIGLTPHAPYSTGPQAYAGCTDLALAQGYPLTTHLAELLEEEAFTREASGPFRALLERFGLWRDDIAAAYAHDLTPIAWLAPQLARAPWLLAHGNYVNDDDLATLARTGASIAYCPIASTYFEHPHQGREPHRYRDMLDAGVTVCLGTDSIVCQPSDESQPLGIMALMRHLHQRDGTDATTLLAMATINGVRGLGLDDHAVPLGTLRRGAPAYVVACTFDPDDATDALTQVLRRSEPVQALDFRSPPHE